MSLPKFSRLIQSTTFLGFVMLGLMVIITVSSLTFATEQVTKGYVLRELEEKHDRLLVENEQHQMRISRARSMENVVNEGRLARMVPANEVVFMVDEGRAIASKLD